MDHISRMARRPRGRALLLALLAALVAAPWHTPARALADSGATSTFNLVVNPGLAAGKPFACPAMQNAKATITVSNRFAANAFNDTMILAATGLPPKTGFDVFLVEHSPVSDAAFNGFGL